MEIVRIPRMKRMEYDRLIAGEYLSRIVFKGEEYPHIGPFLYVFDGKFIYFLSTKYGKKIRYFQQDPNVTVEIEKYNHDFSNYYFVILSGRIVEVKDFVENKTVREMFIRLIKDKQLSKNILVALGHLPDESVEAISESDRILVWKLVDVKDVTGFKSGI